MRELVAEQHAVDEAEAGEYASIVDDSEDVGGVAPDCECNLCVTRSCEKGADGRGAVPDKTYENVENVARRTFAIAEELKQVGFITFVVPRLLLSVVVQSTAVQAERTERLKVVAAEVKALKP